LLEQELCSVCIEYILHKHKGNIWYKAPSYAFCLQWLCPMHQLDPLRYWASSSWGRHGAWSLLLECLWKLWDTNHSPSLLLAWRPSPVHFGKWRRPLLTHKILGLKQNLCVCICIISREVIKENSYDLEFYVVIIAEELCFLCSSPIVNHIYLS